LADDNLDLDELDEQGAKPVAKAAGKTDAKKKERGPGLFSRLGRRVTSPLGKRKPGELLSAKTITVLVLLALVTWLFIANWAPVPIVLWFRIVNVPGTVAFLFSLVLGALLMWLWLWRRGRRKPVEREGGK